MTKLTQVLGMRPIVGFLKWHENVISSPNEWCRWENNLQKNSDIKILLSIDSTSFSLGTCPKPYEIWHSGYYTVIWTNKNTE